MTSSDTATGERSSDSSLVRNIGTIVALAIVLGLAIQLAMIVTRAIPGSSPRR